ncbi:FG-GAP-like repeat-containing protein [Streptomyces sp. MZ04]|uniref:FG-GAP-like repeat-containing protein n=1 Tax=Streptomyces sp. MZ04 TaxID=2559236 RepID=UPI00107E8E15|nr:FG-GAP-like repeat-containing protein [Streptomyces sp. MZ04]TGB07519.1 integrin-like protein [Streptomyces sp. MZ04]
MHTRTLALAAATALAATGLTLPFAAASVADEPARIASDFNGDGYADLAVGVPSGSVGGDAKAGYVSVVFGGEYGPGPHGVRRITQATVEVPGTPEAGDRFGAAVTSAYIDDDEYADLVIGAPGEDIDAKADAGSVTVLYGAGDGFSEAGTAARGAASNDAYGNALVAADFTGDTDVDLAIGGKDKVVANFNPLTAGTSTVMADRMGGRAPVMTTGDFNNDSLPDLALGYYTQNQPYTQSHLRLYGWNKDESSMGNFWNNSNGAANALASGDFNGDGFDDLAVGNCREIADENIDDPCGPEELTKGGGIHIRFGDANGSFGWEQQTFNQDTAGMPGVAETGDGFGDALAVADIDADGHDDLIAGAPGEAIGSAAKAGSVTVLKGGEMGLLDPAGAANQGTVAFQQNTPGILGAAEAGDRFGGALGFGDHNGDGVPDLSVAAPGENSSAGGVWDLPGAKAGGSVVTPNSLGLPASSDPLAYGAVLGK